MSAPITTRDVTVGELTFRLSETGVGLPHTIVWLHGSGPGVTALSNWEWMIGEMGSEYHCVTPDIIGFGDSTHPDPAPQGMGDFSTLRVNSLLALFDTLGLTRVTLVGNSMGGMLSVAIAQQAPERVAHLVLMGSGGGPAPDGPLPGLKQLMRFYDNPTAENMADLMTQFVNDPSFFGGKLEEIATARMPLALRPEVERSHRATFGPGTGKPPFRTSPEALGAINIPTLVVHGDNDRIVPVSSGQHYAEHIPGARFEIFANTGHWLQIEQGPQFAALLREFLTPKA